MNKNRGRGTWLVVMLMLAAAGTAQAGESRGLETTGLWHRWATLSGDEGGSVDPETGTQRQSRMSLMGDEGGSVDPESGTELHRLGASSTNKDGGGAD